MTTNFPCPVCGGASNVKESKGITRSAPAVRRRRVCQKCKHRWTTYEHHAAVFDNIDEVVSTKRNLKRAMEHLQKMFGVPSG